MLHILAFDPGQTTGWCYLQLDQSPTLGPKEFFSKQNTFEDLAPLLLSMVQWAKDRNRDGHTFIVANEKFTITPKTPNSPWSLEMTGVTRLFAQLVGCPFNEYRPSDTKRLITDEALKRAGLWDRGHQHARDALRVGAYEAVVKHKLLTNVLFGSTV